MNKQDLIVQLFAPTRGRRGRIGTAYPVSENVLMTAAHVVGDSLGEKIEARWWHLKGADGHWRTCEAILWDGRTQVEPCDVVLLKCPFPAAATGQWGRLAAKPPEDFKQWTGAGFPLVGEKGQVPVPLKGECYSAAGSEKKFSLGIDDPTDVDENWCGASGSPVFVDDAIVGVVVEVPQNFRAGRFFAVSVLQLTKNDAFCSLVNYLQAEDQRQQLISLAKATLMESMPAMTALSKELEFSSPNTGLILATSLLAKLLALPDANAVGDVVHRAQERCLSSAPESPDAIKCLGDLAMLLFPAKLSADHVQQIHVIANVNSKRFDFQASTHALAEIAIARYFGRPAIFSDPKTQDALPQPAFLLETPVVAEIDRTGETFKMGFVKEMLFRLSLAGVADDLSLKTVNRINAELSVRKRRRQAFHYYVYSLSENPDNCEFVRRTIGELKDLFPLVVFVELASPNGSVQEFESVQLLLRILRRAAGYDWKLDGRDETPD